MSKDMTYKEFVEVCSVIEPTLISRFGDPHDEKEIRMVITIVSVAILVSQAWLVFPDQVHIIRCIINELTVHGSITWKESNYE